MNAAIVIFMIVSTIFAIATLIYVAADLILEMRRREESEEEKPVPVLVPTPEKEKPVVVPEEVEPPVVPEIVEHVNAEEADSMISDELAMEIARYERGAGHGAQDIVNIGELDACFEANDVVTIGVLKEKGLISKKAACMKVLADGELTKPLVIKSESYSIQAIKMIELTGGTVVILKD